MRASPGIEPGPLAPEASILPLNYEAIYLIYFSFYSLLSSSFFWKEKKGHNRIRTNDHGNCSPMLYHWAMRPPTIPVVFSLSCLTPLPPSDKKTPPVGLEPTTLRLKAARSTDWARKALAIYFPTDYSLIPHDTYIHLLLILCRLSLSTPTYHHTLLLKKGALAGIEPAPPAP